ncbi:MAG TPA: ABC transporter transmembrane domain-containing protein, partial [Roseiflexaceae bacterium]
YNLRVTLYGHLQKLSLAFYNQQRTGDILTRVTGDVTALEDFVISSLSDIVGSLLVLAGTLAYLLYRSWQVALVAALIVPFVALVSNYFAQRIKSASKKQRAREGELASAAQEMLTSIRVIQTYGGGGNEQKRFAEQNQKTMDVALEAARLQAVFSWVVKLLEALSTVSIIWLGLWLIGQNVLTVGTLLLFVILIDQMFKPTKKIIKEWNTFGKMYASAERINELLDRKPAVEDLPGAIQAPPLKGHIEYRHISFAYQADPGDGGRDQEAQPQLALRDVNLSITPGEVLALVGGSGAGKSTIVQLLPRLYDPHAGQVTIDGHDIREFTLESLRAQMSMVLQETVLFTGSVADNIAYGRADATREEIIAAAMQANAHEFIEKLPKGYDTELGERAASLSGGQRQRLAIARAFIRNSPILILDEPTTGLDAESTDLVLLALRSLMKGKSTIIVSHDLNLIRHANKIVVIKQGQVEQIGTHKELLTSGGLYADLYHKQFGQAVAEQGGQIKPAAAQLAAEDEEDEPISPKVFQTLMTQALPKPISSQAFQTILFHALPAPGAEQGSGGAVAQGSGGTSRPSTPVDAPALSAAPAAAPAPAQAAPTHQHKPAIFETTLMRTIPLPTAAAPNQPATPAPPPAAPQLTAEQLDLRNSAVVQRELPGLQIAFDAEAMRGYLQPVLFGKTQTRYTIERCTPGKAIYAGDGCVLRYQLEVSDSASGQTLEPLVVGRIFQDQLACAVYMRDRLAPLAALMRDREEIAPFAAPVAMIEPLNMVVHVFPIDGELPALVGATDRRRMVEIFNETLPDALTDRFIAQDCRIMPVNYARRYRCVMRYEIAGTAPGSNKAQKRVVYGKIATDSQGALIGQVIAALREHLSASGATARFRIPRSLGFRPDLQLSLLEAIPGTPKINQLLKARLSGAEAGQRETLTLEAAIDACAGIASALHTSGIAIGRRRTLDGELTALNRDIEALRRVAPELGARFQSWLERIETYAEESDPLRLCFSHGDYTYAQVIFDGPQSGLVDFDTICQAEPALDLGQFLAYMRVAAHKARKAAAATPNPIGEQLGARFLDAYIAAAGDHLEDAERLRVRVSVYEIVSLMRMALHSWQQIKPARLENALAVLEEEIACLPQLNY